MEEYKHLFEYQNFFQRFAHVKSHLLCGEEKDITPFVTIIIPTYKRPALLKDAIDSAVNQKGFDDYEVVIVDNDPEQSFKTETQLLVESYQNTKIRYYKHDENIGMFANWNRGVELAKGKWVTFLHDDDYYFSNYLAHAYKILTLNSKIQGLKCKQFSWKDNKTQNISSVEFYCNKSNYKYKNRLVRKNKFDNFYRNSIGPTGLFYKKNNIQSLGGFNTEFGLNADYLFGSLYILKYNTYLYYRYTGVYRWYQNESLNHKTVADMDYNNLKHVRELGKMIGFPKWYANYMSIYLVKRYIKMYDNDVISSFEKLKRINEYHIPVSLFFEFTYKIYWIYNRIRNNFFSKFIC